MRIEARLADTSAQLQVGAERLRQCLTLRHTELERLHAETRKLTDVVVARLNMATTRGIRPYVGHAPGDHMHPSDATIDLTLGHHCR